MVAWKSHYFSPFFILFRHAKKYRSIKIFCCVGTKLWILKQRERFVQEKQRWVSLWCCAIFHSHNHQPQVLTESKHMETTVPYMTRWWGDAFPWGLGNYDYTPDLTWSSIASAQCLSFFISSFFLILPAHVESSSGFSPCTFFCLPNICRRKLDWNLWF